MTPQQKKADELVERFRKYAKIGTDSPVTGRTENAIQCAIICVEEIISQFDVHPSMLAPYIYERLIYWQSVLNELKSRL